MPFIKKLNFHYAWVILAAACILSIVSRADSASFGVFIDPLVEQFGWTRGQISFAYSLAFLLGLPAVVIMGWLGDRYGTRQLMLGTSIVIGTGTVLLGTIKELWQFYVFYGFFVGSLGHAAFSVLLPVILTRWFPIISKQMFGAKAPLGSIYSFEMLGASTGMALGGWLGGGLFDNSGDYTWSLLVSLLIGCVGLPLALALPRHKKSVPVRVESPA